jgi:hypothetical protein
LAALRAARTENVFVTTDERVKILDFGLAKLTQVETAGAATSALPTTPLGPAGLGTTPGMVLGTLGYMSPEQVRGAASDHRTDIFALGAILWEMATGQRAFRGESAIETMTAILRDQPADRGLAVPPALRRTIDHCLEKRPEARFQSAHDIALALDAMADPAGSQSLAVGEGPRHDRVRRGPTLAWKAAAVAAVLAAAALAPSAIVHWREQPAPWRVARFTLDLPASATWGGAFQIFEVSPDGRVVAFVATTADEGTRIWVRPLDSLAARAVTGRESVDVIFWSPDSRTVAFAGNGVLKTVDLAGTVVQTIGRIPDEISRARFGLGGGGTWGPDGTILIGAGGVGSSVIWRGSAGGGPMTPIGTPDPLGFDAFPTFLPDGRYLFSRTAPGPPGIYIGDLTSTEMTRVAHTTGQTRYAAGETQPGVAAAPA